MLDTQLAYFAGLLDGEGTVTIRMKFQGSNYFYPAIQVANTYEPVIKLFAMAFGLHYDVKKVEGHKTLYSARSSNQAKIQEILEQLLPYLIIKAENAKLVLEWMKLNRARKKTTLISDDGKLLGTSREPYSPRAIEIINRVRTIQVQVRPSLQDSV